MKKIIFLLLFLLPFTSAYSLNFCPLSEEELLRSVDVIEGRWIESAIDLEAGDVHLARSFFELPRSLEHKAYGWHFNLPIFSSNSFPNAPPHRKFAYERDDLGRLISIVCLTELEEETTGALSISYSEDPAFHCTLKSAGGRFVRYWFEPFEKNTQVLARIEKSGEYAITYKYQPHPTERRPLLTQRSEAGETLFFTYWESGKLKEIKRKESEKSAIETVCSLTYGSNETLAELKKSSIRFTYNNEHLITAIETPIRKVCFEWENQKVTKKTLIDSLKSTLSIESFAYDKEGRLISDTLEGNLTGEGIGIYSRHYLYDEQGRLISLCDSSSAVTTWRYQGSSPFPESKCEAQTDKAFMQTEYIRNEKGWLIEELLSDPNPKGSNRVAITHHQRFAPGGCPLETIQGHDSSEEKRTLISLDKDGKILTKEVFDSKGCLIEFSRNVYDLEGRLEKEENTNGTKIYLYDGQEGLQETIETSEETITHTLFDRKKRVLWKTIQNPNEVIHTLTFEYNAEGKVSATYDHLGQKVQYAYDAFGRKISEQLPPLLSEDGDWVTPTAHYEYDSFDRIVKIVDPEGYATTTTYNARGQPILILHPDGSQESFKYSPDGKIEQMRTREGLLIVAVRDLYDRVTQEKTFDRKGQQIHFKEYTYDAFDLRNETDSEGGTTSYEYDLQGRIIKTVTNGCVTEFQYDLNKKHFFKRRHFKNESYETYFDSETDTWFLKASKENVHLERKEKKKTDDSPCRESIVIGPGGVLTLKAETTNSKGVKTITYFDAMGRPSQIEKRSCHDQLLFKQEIFYSLCGKVSIEKTYRIYKGNIRDCVENRFFYGPCGRIECVIEKWGKSDSETTNYSYGDFGALRFIQKPDGVKIFYEYDDAALLQRLYSSDATVDYSYDYDARKNPCTITNNCTGNKTFRRYNSFGHLREEVLENGLQIAFEYDDQGRRVKTLLPDASSIEYEFDSLLLRCVKKCDRNGKELYSHTYLNYNLTGKPLLEKRIAQTGFLQKKYSDQGALLSIVQNEFSQEREDQLSTIITKTPYGILKEHYSYDDLGQITAVEGCKAETYHFDSFGTETEDQFSCQYDLNGNLITKRMNGKLLNFRYDALDRLIAVFEDGELIQKMGYDALHRRIFLKTQDDLLYLLYDGNMEIGAFDKTHSQKELRVIGHSDGSESHSTIAVELNGIPYAPFHDLQGSMCGLVATDGEIKTLKHFQVFGAYSILTSTLDCPWGYFSKREDQATGLVHFGRRFYDPLSRSWISKDPIGFADGPNRRLFAKNDPLHFQDLFGLTAVPQDSHSIKEHLKQLLRQAGVKILHAMRKFRDYMTMDKEQILNHLIGGGVLHFLGFKKTGEESGVYGLGEVNDKVRVSFINGILTDYTSLYSNLQALSESHGHVNIHYVYRPTKGWVWDIVHSFLVKLGYVSNEAKQLASDWKKMIEEMGGVDGGGKIIHYAHSIGAVESLRALSLLSPEEQKLISMYAFGSPNISSSAGLADIHHFVSVRDGVSLLDPVGFIRACRGGLENVLFVGTFLGLPFVDHLFTAQTYQDLWRSMGRTFIEWYGTFS